MALNGLGFLAPAPGPAAQSTVQGKLGGGVRWGEAAQCPQPRVSHLRVLELEVLSGGRTDPHGYRGSGGAGKGCQATAKCFQLSLCLLGRRSPRFQYLQVATC